MQQCFMSNELDFTNVPINEFKVTLCKLRSISTFIEKWHYSKNVNGLNISYCFKLSYKNEIVGAIIYGKLGMANVWKKYTQNFEKLLELKRLCCIDKTPKNTESYFISRTLKWLKQNTNIDTIISYADPYHGHEGIVYQATNFGYEGKTSPGKVILFNGITYHDKTIRNYNNGKLKPYSQRLRDALAKGKAKYINVPGKNIYLYGLRGRKKKERRIKI